MSFETDRSANHEKDIPDNLDEAIEVLEDRYHEDLEEVISKDPGPAAPLSVRVPYSIEMARVRAEGEVLDELQQAREKVNGSKNN